MNVLVTGGAGFIGSHLVDRLLEQGNNVITVDNFDPFYDRSIKENNISGHRTHDNYRLLEEDIRNLEALRNKITKDANIDVIVHMAAKAGGRPSVKDPIGFPGSESDGANVMLK